MDCEDDPKLHDQEEPMDLEESAVDFENILGSNFAEINFEQELAYNNQVFEKMIFENDNPGDYNILNSTDAREVLNSAKITEGKFFFQRLLVKKFTLESYRNQ